MKFFLIILSIITFNISFSQLNNNKLNILIASGKYEQAIQLLNKMIKSNPKDEVLYSKRGVLYERVNDYNSAILDYNKAIKLNDKDDKIYYIRGKILEKQNKDSLAILDFQKAISFKNHSDYYFYKGVSLHKLGKKDQACDDWNTSSKIAGFNKYPKFHECQVDQLFTDKTFNDKVNQVENIDSLIINKQTTNIQKSSSQEIKEYFERIQKNKELKKLEELKKQEEIKSDSIQVQSGEKFEDFKPSVSEPKVEQVNQKENTQNKEVIEEIQETKKSTKYEHKKNKAVQTDFPERYNKKNPSAVKDFYNEGKYKKSKKTND